MGGMNSLLSDHESGFQTADSPQNPLHPTFEGYPASTLDALVLFEACLSGQLSHVHRRPQDRERQDLIKSGNVFIYEEHASGIKRWIDGISWSPSRILGNLLIYRELEKPWVPGNKHALKESKKMQRDIDNPDSSRPNKGMSFPPAIDPSANYKDTERALIGSLIDSYHFKPNGLLKKTISVTFQGVPIDTARQTMASFRNSCLSGTARCAVTAKGRSWYMNPTVGLGVEACHVVPQQHYHVYPVPRSFPEGRYDPRRLRAAWERTWSAKNGLLLFSHLHELFDARLFSIHPDSLRIRVFMPYDVLLDYHGVLAQLSSTVDRRALRHHYEMCCIENMAADMPLSEAVSLELPKRPSASGAVSPFDPSSHTPIFAGVASPGDAGAAGDPSKRYRPAGDGPADLEETIELSTVGHSSMPSSTRSWSDSPLLTSQDGYSSEETEDRHRDKRRRISDNDCLL
ncbi:hypothetical protein ACHAPT_011899 [Fusarium lateritium]